MMTPEQTDFRVGVIKPVECIKEGWALIKDEYWLFLGISFVGLLIGCAAWVFLLGPMMVGIFLCLFQKQRGQPFDFAVLFKGFDYFGQSLIVALIKAIPMFLVMVPYFIFFFGAMMASMPRGGQLRPEEASQLVFSMLGIELVFYLVIIVVSILVEIFFMFAFPLIADRGLSGLDAIKLSAKAGKANLGGVLGLVFLNVLLATLGGFLCCVGGYLYLPIAFAAQVVAYRRVFPDTSQTFASPPPPPASWA
jgi:uncharacterized membrane protein